FRSELQQLYSEIAADTQSAFRSRGKAPETAITRSAGGNAGFSIGKSKEPIAPIQHQQEGPVSYTSQDQDAAPDDRQTDRRKVGEPYKQETSSRDDPEMRLPFVLHVGNPTSEQRSASNRYKHDAIINNGGIGRTSELLHAAWTAACRHAIEKLIDSNPYVVDAGETWSAGFVFDASMEACHMKAEGVDHALLLNPVDDKGRLQFKISDPASMKRLVSLAIHEVSHIASSWHDERFATTMTNLVGAIRDTEIEKDIREEMDRSRSWIAERAEMSRNEEPSESPAP
ncbi:MAG: hypothetical protein ABJN42_12270, partial [Roseibium sp.]|uniref:hypothetical protein n=1 Tax=Roseibium sp. TaxID=1936156 RepID=UPI003296B42B